MTIAKKRVKHGLQRMLPSNLPPVVVASMGRSGSTLIWNGVRRGFTKKRFPRPIEGIGSRLVSEQIWDLKHARFAPGVVYKTHGLARDLQEGVEIKAVFVFGRASDAALSVLSCRNRFGDDWVERHLEHLGANGRFDEISERDVLRFEDQLNDWTEATPFPSLSVRYDAIWDHAADISSFVGAPVELPPQRARESLPGLSAATVDRFRDTYAALDARIEKMPSISVVS